MSIIPVGPERPPAVPSTEVPRRVQAAPLQVRLTHWITILQEHFMLPPKTLPKTSGAFIAQRVMSATDPDNVLFRGGDPDFMTSLARGLHVIRAFAGVDRRLTI